jgi:hypothetical protein
MSIQVPEDLEARLRDRARDLGITVDELATAELAKLFPPKPVRTLRGKGALRADSGAPSARSLKAFLRDEVDDE